MPRTRECDYCGSDIEPGTGTMLVFNTGATMHFCASKCEKNADLGREARSLEWTAAGQAMGGRAAAVVEDEEPVAETTEVEAEADEPEADVEAEADEADAESEDVEDEAEEAETDDDSEDAEADAEAEADDEDEE